MADGDDSIEAHNARMAATQLASAILARFDGGRPISVMDLTTLDQLHSRGAVATREWARLVGISRRDARLRTCGKLGLGPEGRVRD